MEIEHVARSHQLSPSSWNRYEECPRKYWLSRQRLPRKANMAASVGTVVHNSVEDLCNLELQSMSDGESDWLPGIANDVLEGHWRAEKEKFDSTPRHPKWKPEYIKKAQDGLIGALNILLQKAKIPQLPLSEVKVGTWRKVQQIVLGNENTLVSECGKLMGRLDLLIKEQKDGEEVWIVADLKTGRPPEGDLNEKVNRQLRLYRDLIIQRNTDHPPIYAEGWYSANQTIHRAKGPSILQEAYDAWERMRPSKEPLPATPSKVACSFCEWKAWCPSWWVARKDGDLAPSSMFRDEVVKLVRFDQESGAALFERAPPIGVEGDVASSEHRFGAMLKDQALERMRELEPLDSDTVLYLGSARLDGKVMHLGDWSEILLWEPILHSLID